MKAMGWLGILLLGLLAPHPPAASALVPTGYEPRTPTHQFHSINQMRNATKRIRE